MSDADDWYNYPHLTGARNPVSAAAWDPAGADAHLGYMNWWYRHLPHARGRGTDGRLANWWRYLADLDQFKRTDGDLRGTTGTAEVRVSAPASGSGVVRVRAEARADGAVGRVDFYVDGAYRATDALAPYTFDWDTSGVGGGPHAVVAKAYELQNGTEAVSAAAVVWLTSPRPAAPASAPAAGAAE